MIEHANCRQLLDSLSGYVDNDLDDQLCAEIERHMAGCENCRIVIDTLRKTIDLVHNTTPEPEVSEDVRGRLFHRLELDEFLKK